MQHKTRLQMSLSKFFKLNTWLKLFICDLYSIFIQNLLSGVIDMDRTSFAAVIAVILVVFNSNFPKPFWHLGFFPF